MGDTTLPVQPKPVQDRPLGENLHKDLHSCPCPGTKRPEIQDVTVSREALKSPRGDQAGHPVPPGAQGMERSRSARPATANMFATPPLALPPSADPGFETELYQTIHFERLVRTGVVCEKELQSQRT